MTLAVLRPAWARITRVPGVWLPFSAWAALALVLAASARMHLAAHGADAALLGAWSGIALPLLAYATVGAVAKEGLGPASRPLAALGLAPARAAASSVVVAILFSAFTCALLGAAVVAIAGTDRPLVADLLTSAWISALAAGAYAAFFAMGASFGARGAGRGTLLVLDWILGDGHGTLALFTPRAHLRALLGGTPLDVVPTTASVPWLVGILVVAACVGSLRAPKQRS